MLKKCKTRKKKINSEFNKIRLKRKKETKEENQTENLADPYLLSKSRK